MSIVLLIPYSISTFPLISLSYSLSFDIYCNLLYIFPHLLLLLAISNFSSPTLSFSTSLYILLLVHHNVTRLFPLSMFHLLVHRLFPLLTLGLPLPTCHSSSLNTFTPVFFISSTILTISLSLLLVILIFSNIPTSGPFILLLISYKANGP